MIRHVNQRQVRLYGILVPKNGRPRLGDTGTPYVTASIISATAEDGSALDTPLSLDYCGKNENCVVSLSMSDGQPDAIVGNNASSPTGSATGGNGSGGISPFSGGLGLKLPNLGLPTLPTWLYWALGGVAGLVLIDVATGGRHR